MTGDTGAAPATGARLGPARLAAFGLLTLLLVSLAARLWYSSASPLSYDETHNLMIGMLANRGHAPYREIYSVIMPFSILTMQASAALWDATHHVRTLDDALRADGRNCALFSGLSPRPQHSRAGSPLRRHVLLVQSPLLLRLHLHQSGSRRTGLGARSPWRWWSSTAHALQIPRNTLWLLARGRRLWPQHDCQDLRPFCAGHRRVATSTHARRRPAPQPAPRGHLVAAGEAGAGLGCGRIAGDRSSSCCSSTALPSSSRCWPLALLYARPSSPTPASTLPRR